MPLIFGDSFNHYDTPQLGAKWTFANNGTIVTNALSRTGTRALAIVGGVNGPQIVFANNYTKLIGQVAVRFDTPGATQNPTIMEFGIAGVQYNIGVRANGDGSMSIFRGPGDTAEVQIGTSTTRPFVWSSSNYIECTCFFSATVGTVVLNVNGQQVINLSGLRTVAFAVDQFSNAFQLFGVGNDLLNDCAVIDWSTSPNNAPIAQAKVYAEVPNANGAVSWTPLAGTNFNQVNEIPPDGDTSYNFSSTIGQVDQYQHPLTGVPVAAAFSAAQYCMDAKVDSGARTIVADVAGNASATAFALTTSYVIYPTPYDVNPATSSPFVQADFPVAAGPKVTA